MHVVRLLAYLTSGFPGDTARHASAPVHESLNLPRPATPRKPPPALSCSGLRTSPRTPNAERLTEVRSETVAPSALHTPGARSAGLAARPCSDRGDGRVMEGIPAMRTPEVPGKRAAADSGHRLRSRGGKSMGWYRFRTQGIIEGASW